MSTEKFKIRDRRGNNRYFIDNALLRGGWGARVGPYAIAVYNALALHADVDDQSGYPSIAKIAALTGMSDRQVQRSITRLEGWHIIYKETRFIDADNRQTSNEYILLSPDEWIAVNSILARDIDQQSPPGDSQSPPPVTHSHPPGDSQSPKQDSSNKTQLKVGPITQKLLALCRLDFNNLTKRQDRNLTEALDILVTRRKITEQDLDLFEKFWSDSWRNGPPTLLQIPETWGEFEQWKITPPSIRNGREKTPAIVAGPVNDEYGGYYA